MKAKLVLATATILLLNMLTITAYSTESSKAVGVWLFNEGEGDVARDSSGNNHHGQILAGVKWTEGTSGSALKFPGKVLEVTEDRLYTPVREHVSSMRYVDLTAVPYYTWANRGAGAMRVWIPKL